MNQIKVRQWLWWLLGVVVIVAVVFYGWYFVDGKKGTISPSPSPITKLSPSSTTSGVPADWETYTNDQYGFNIQYPKDWKAEEEPKNNSRHWVLAVSFTSPEMQKNIAEEIPDAAPEIVLVIYENKNNLDLNQFIHQNPDIPTIVSQSKTTVNDQDAYKLEVGGMVNSTEYDWIHNAQVFCFSYWSQEEVALKILSTFTRSIK